MKELLYLENDNSKVTMEVYQHPDKDIEFEIDDRDNVCRFYLKRSDLPKLINFLEEKVVND